MLPVGVDDQRVQAGLGGRPFGGRYPFQDRFLAGTDGCSAGSS